MAARLNGAHQKDIRDKIKTSQLVNRLQDFVLDGKDAKTGEPVEIDSGRLKAIEILLRKALPDLQALQIEADVTHNIILPKPLSADEWAKRHADE